VLYWRRPIRLGTFSPEERKLFLRLDEREPMTADRFDRLCPEPPAHDTQWSPSSDTASFLFLSSIEHPYLRGTRLPRGGNVFDALSSAIASSRTPRRISFESTAANPSCSPSRSILPWL
jgi:hypothetical protein